MLALFVALGGGALAATKFVSSDGRIDGCVDKKGRLVLAKPGKRCRKGTVRIAWNQHGPPGKNGREGPPGPATGPAGGDLSGNYPNPTIKDSLKDAPAGTASLRSLGTGPFQAMPGNATPSPGGAAGGDLSGNYPNPTIGVGTVTPDKFATIPAARAFNPCTNGTTLDEAVPGDGTLTPVVFFSESFDTANMHTNTCASSSDGSKLTAPIAGIYQVSASVVWDGSHSAGSRFLGIRKNGATYLAGSRIPGLATPDVPENSVATLVHLDVSDDVEAVVSQNSGATISLATAFDRDQLAISWVAPG